MEYSSRIIKWDVERAEPRLVPPTFAYSGLSVGFSPQGNQLAVGINNGNPSLAVTESVFILRFNDESIEWQPARNPGKTLGHCYAPTYTPDGRYLVVPYETGEGNVRILDAATRQVVDEIHGVAVNRSAAVRPDSRMFAVSERESVVLWTLAKH